MHSGETPRLLAVSLFQPAPPRDPPTMDFRPPAIRVPISERVLLELLALDISELLSTTLSPSQHGYKNVICRI
jgi:hypothetical protein